MKTVVITGASQGIGLCTARAFVQRGYAVVASARDMSKAHGLKESDKVAYVEGNIAEPATAKRIVGRAIEQFGGVDALVNNAGIFFVRPFMAYTPEDLRKLTTVNIDGFVNLTQLAIGRMVEQDRGGSVVSITTSLVDHPIASLSASFPVITKGAIAAISRTLALEFAAQKIRVNCVAPGLVNTPMNKRTPRSFMESLSPMGIVIEPDEIADAVVFLTEAKSITGQTLHVDGGAHVGKW